MDRNELEPTLSLGTYSRNRMKPTLMEVRLFHVQNLAAGTMASGTLSLGLLKKSQQESRGQSWLALSNAVLGDDHSAGMSSFIKWSGPLSTFPRVLWSMVSGVSYVFDLLELEPEKYIFFKLRTKMENQKGNFFVNIVNGKIGWLKRLT